MTRDLGTYHVRAVFEDGRGFIMRWPTGMRFSHGTIEFSPLDATLIPPTWESEEDLFGTILFMFTEGNYDCDCNLGDFLARAAGEDDVDLPCGNTIRLSRLSVIRPDGTEECLLDRSTAPP